MEYRAHNLSRYELYSTCSDDVLCSFEGAISGYIEPVQWWYQLIDDDDICTKVRCPAVEYICVTMVM